MMLFAETIDIAGSVLIAFAALRVHHRFLNEHKVDEKVFTVMRFEQRLGVLGVLLIITSYILRVFII